MSRRDRRREAAAVAVVQEQPAPVVHDDSDVLHVEVTDPVDEADSLVLGDIPEQATVSIRTDGYVTCRVTVSSVIANRGKQYMPGDVSDFLIDDVASLPDFLIPV